MKKFIVGTVSFLSLASVSTQSATLYTVPDPLSGTNSLFKQPSFSLPSPGSRIPEPISGLNLTRLTNPGTDGSRHEYSRFDPYNKGQSMIILNGRGGRSNVYRTKSYPYNGVGNLVTRLPVSEARWDRNDPNKIWGLSRFAIKTVNPTTGKTTVIKDFSKDPVLKPYLGSGAYRITMKDEGEASYNKRYWAFLVQGDASNNYQGKHIFTWDRQTDKVLGVYTLRGKEKNIDWVGMSPKGNYVLIGGLNYKGNEQTENITGLTMASKDFSRFNRLDYTTAHADVGIDSNGNEVIVMQNTRTDYVDLIPIDWKTKAIKSASQGYEGTNRTKLLKLNYSNSPDGFQGGVHISANHDGYALISTTLGNGKQEQNWLDKSMVLVKLDPDNPEAEILSKTYNTTTAYWQETHGTITNDGKKVLWSANWDHPGSGSDFDNFLLELDLTGTGIPENSPVNSNPPNLPPPEPVTVVTPEPATPSPAETPVNVVEEPGTPTETPAVNEIPPELRWWDPAYLDQFSLDENLNDGDDSPVIDDVLALSADPAETPCLAGGKEQCIQTEKFQKSKPEVSPELITPELSQANQSLELATAEVSAVPIPGALLLMASSLIGLLGFSGNKRKT